MPIPTFAELMPSVLKYSAEKVWAMRGLVAHMLMISISAKKNATNGH
jgi:hypothetical protein